MKPPILQQSRPGRQYILIIVLPIVLLLMLECVPVSGLPKIWDLAEDEGTVWADLDEKELDENPDPNHKIISKSIIPMNASNDVPEDEATGDNVKVRHIESGGSRNMPFPSPLSSTVIHFHRGKGDVSRAEAASVSRSESAAKRLSFVEGQKSHEEDVEAEDQIRKDVQARKKSGKKPLRLRNFSELHIDNHNETYQDETKNISKSSPDFMPQVVYLQKPFHFHIPIVIPPMSGEGISESSHMPEVQQQDQDPDKTHENDDDFDQDQRSQRDPSTFVNKRGTVTGPSNPEASKSEQDPNPDLPKPILNAHGYDISQLIDQYPKLIPSINRKRYSGKGNAALDLLDERRYHMSLVNVPASEAEDASNPTNDTAEDRPIKNIKFSQDIVDSILGHEDDFVKYQQRIKSHAEKLGLRPEDVFQAVVYGTIPPNINTTNVEEHEIHRRRQQFQKLFLDEVEESEGIQNSPSHNPGDPAISSNYDQQRYNAYMKILKRNKRGIKSWFKKVFKRGESKGDPPRPPPPPPTPSPSRRKKFDKHAKKSSHGKTNNANQNVEVDENGDSEVDMLLPKALRRSTYLHNRDMIKKLIREEGAFEEEYEKSEEHEQKYRNQKEPKRRRRSAAPQEEDDDYLEKGEERAMREITSLSKDEVILISEMVLNLMEIQCEKAEEDDDERNRSLVLQTLGNVRMVTERVLETSGLPDLVEGEERSIVEALFSQLLACTNWWRGANDTYYSEVDRPHRRTKRVRRVPIPQGEALGWDTISGGDELSMLNNGRRAISKPDESDADKVERNIFMNSIEGLKGLHSLFYKLALGNCQPFLEEGAAPDLLHDSTLHLLRELGKLRATPLTRRKELSEYFQNYPIEMNVDEVTNKCYFGI